MCGDGVTVAPGGTDLRKGSASEGVLVGQVELWRRLALLQRETFCDGGEFRRGQNVQRVLCVEGGARAVVRRLDVQHIGQGRIVN